MWFDDRLQIKKVRVLMTCSHCHGKGCARCNGYGIEKTWIDFNEFIVRIESTKEKKQF